MESCFFISQAPSQTQLNVCDLKTITSTLASVLNKTFGPRGQATLLVSSTGQASMVKDGLETLSSLRISHPVAKSVQKAAKKLIDVYGDGCKTMVFYLSSLFCTLERQSTLHSGFSSDNCGKSQMFKALQAFLTHSLPPLLSRVENFIQIRMQNDVECQDVSWVLFHVMSTYLNGCVPHQAVHPVAELIVQYFTKENVNLHDYNESLQCLSSCIFITPEKSYSSSFVESGVFLQRPLLHKSKEISSVNLICMLCAFDGMSSKGEEGDYICLLQDPKKILEHRRRLTEQGICVLREKNVSFLICSAKVHSYALSLCLTAGLAVIDCVEESDIEFICSITGKSPVSSIHEDINCTSVMKVSSCTQIVDGQLTYSKILFEGDDLRWKPRSIFLCAPSESLGKQLKKAVEKAMIVACHMLRDNDSNLGLNSQEKTEFDKGHRQPFRNIVPGGGYFEMVVCQFLSDHNHSSESSSSAHRWCCHVVTEMLTALPQILHHSLSRGRQKQKEWMLTVKLLKENIRYGNNICGLNASGQVSNPLDSGIIEVLSIKCATLYSALSMALCLLNLDAILSARKHLC